MKKPDLVSLHWLWSETNSRLDNLARQVKEGVNVTEASNFCRWLKFSCVVAVLRPYERRMPLPIKAVELQKKCDDLLFESNEWLSIHAKSNTPRDAYISKSQMDSLEAQMASMMRKMEQVVGVEPVALTIVKE